MSGILNRNLLDHLVKLSQNSLSVPALPASSTLNQFDLIQKKRHT